VSQKRTAADLGIYRGTYRSFEWYWDPANEMPGLDVYEQLTQEERLFALDAFEHWGCAMSS
jgi:hypothetical protein